MRTSALYKTIPSAADGITMTLDTVAWTYNAWVEITASAPANAVLAGALITNSNVNSNIDREIQVGIGASSSESAICTFRIGIPSPSSGRYQALMLPVPISGIGGQRVSFRGRTSDTGGATVGIALLYLDNPSSQIYTNKFLTCVPNGANGVSVTPNGTAWANSSWVELTSGIANPIAIAGITVTTASFNATQAIDVEWELGTGAGGAETAITSIRHNTGSTGNCRQVWMLFNGIYTLAASTRVAVRMRKNGTNTTAWRVSLLYYDNLTIGGGGGAGKGPGGGGKKSGGGGLNKLVPGGANIFNIGNPGLDIGSA